MNDEQIKQATDGVMRLRTRQPEKDVYFESKEYAKRVEIDSILTNRREDDAVREVWDE
jgi:hypothetical protein